MKIYVLFIVFILSIYGCADSRRSNIVSTIMLNDSEITVSFFDKLKADTVTIPLSRLVEGCELVQLEDTEDAFFRYAKISVTNNYIGVSQEMGTYKLFSRSGKFLCNVGAIGQGPGEYVAATGVIIDDENELIYLGPFYGDKILVYNTSGRLLKNIEMPQFFIRPFMFLSDDILTVFYIPQTEDKSMAAQINIHTGQVLNEFTTQIPQRDTRYGFYNSRNMRDIFDMVHLSFDTIYHFDISNNLIRPIFTMSNLPEREEVFRNHYQLNKDLVLTSLDEKGKVITDMKNKRSSWVKVKNDYFGNLDAPISSSNFYNGYYVYDIQPEELMEEIERRLTESDCTEKDRQILQKTLSTLKEDTNNVVFIGKLKNEVGKNLF